MRAQRIAGIVALISGSLLVLGIVASAFVSPAALVGNAPGAAASSSGWWGGGWPMGPWMMGNGWGGGPGAGRGPGMMGWGWGSTGSNGSTSSSAAGTPIPNAPEVRVQAANFSFTPNVIRLPKGTDVSLTLVNPTTVDHDITVPALGIHLEADAGQTRSVALHDLPAGTYPAYCSLPGHAQAGMRATIVVE